MEGVFRDLRYGLRQFRRNPVFTAVAVISLGLGIGANTAIFTVLNAVLFKSLLAANPQFSRQLLVLLAATGVVLLIACANVAGLLLARAAARYKEVGVRLSLGASRTRLARQFLTESLLLAFLGGIAGVLIAITTVMTLAQVLSGSGSPLQFSTGLDLRVFAFTAAVTLLTGLLFGLAPAFRGTRVDLNQSLRDTGGATTSSGRLNFAKLLAIAQVALSLLMVVCAGLFARGLLVYNSSAQDRMIAVLWTLFGILALLLAATGLYGVLSYGVARRTNEIGIRMALGAGPMKVVGMILRETGIMIVIGIVAGLGAIIAVTRLIAAWLYGLGELDPMVIAAAVCILSTVGLIAGYIPAVRAAHVNPVSALRHE